MAVIDAGEDRDHLVVAFERVNIDGAAAVRKLRHAGVADELLDAGIGEHVGQFLLRHPLRLDGKEPVEQPLDVGVRCRDVTSDSRRRACSLRSLPLSRRRNELEIRAVGGSSGTIFISGQSLAEAWCGNSAIGFGTPRQFRGCWPSASTSASARARIADTSASRSAAPAVGGEFPVPQRHVEGGVLAAHETRGANAVLVAERERQQQQRPALGIMGDHDEGAMTLARADLPLPGAEEIEALIRRGELLDVFEAAPDGLGLAEIVENIDAGDAADLRRHVAFPPSGCRSRRPWSSQNLCRGLFTFFGLGRPLQRNVNKE